MLELELAQARQLALHSQCLLHPSTEPGTVVRDAGFVRTLGGVDAYLGIRSRTEPQPTKEDVDDLLASGELAVVPSVRGCIYLVRRADVPWSLACAEVLSAKRRQREYGKVGLDDKEINTVGDAICEALSDGPKSTAALRKHLGDEILRSFGDAGKKIGLSSNLPPVLRELEFNGSIERILATRSLDSEQYEWRLAEPSELDPIPADPAHREQAIATHMARTYLRAWPLANVEGFTNWSGFGKRIAKASLHEAGAELDLQPVQVPHLGEVLVPAEQLDQLGDLPAHDVSLLPFLDNLFFFAGGPRLFCADEHLDVEVPKWGNSKPGPLRTTRHMAFRSVLADGHLAGFWEYDPDSGGVALGLFETSSKHRSSIRDKAQALGAFLTTSFGHGRCFSIDSEKAQKRRIGQMPNT